MKRDSLLVTGGAGYVGSHIVDYLASRNYQVIVFDNLSTGHRAAVHPKAEFIEGDLLDKAALQTCFQQYHFDGILHLAALTEVGDSMRRSFAYYHQNTMGIVNLVETAIHHNVNRIIFSSTSNVYARPKVVPINEDERILPSSVYGETKYVAEGFLRWMEVIYGITYCILRYFNAAGAHPNGHIGECHTPETHLIPSVLQVALGKRDHVEIWGTDYDTPDGTCIRDYVHVMDLAAAHELAWKAVCGGTSCIYNLGNEKGYSVQEVIAVCRQVTGHPIPAIEAPRRRGDPPSLISDSSRIRSELNWNPQFGDLETIVRTTWQWHQAHPDGYLDG